MENNNNNRPQREIRFGTLRGTVWNRVDAGGHDRASIVLSKRVWTRDGTWKSLTQFDPDDLPVLLKVIEELCREFVTTPVLKQEAGHE